ncbi:PAQR family membrane homeostasis protein TrhA [Maribacter hydrothermalis]|uniref:Hemolysin III family protein n=1 Tax=Maribacter hydrothermalis TaxID=1836467 RepID=A0A1B7ZDM6_9FLAO|nr:hemolysin III family protein [Maribacter hydrothermalis]APQ19367.1 hemolysin III family protein [Maribacter hydrothermalis]OBR41402.1 hemolysin III family protein [Maribacter hydrothermalis]
MENAINNFTLIEKEEKFNTVSHGIGTILAIIGMVLLLSANNQKSNYAILSIVIYSISLISMLAVSTIYHAVHSSVWKQRMRIIDHINIYYLIAGTYTPVALITLINGNGWFIFFTVWGIALFGTILKVFYTGKFEILSLLLYLTMGWLIVFDFQNLIDGTSKLGVRLLMLGGAFYTIGIVFYAVRRIPYNHFIWHLFVLGGAISHWFFIYLDVV